MFNGLIYCSSTNIVGSTEYTNIVKKMKYIVPSQMTPEHIVSCGYTKQDIGHLLNNCTTELLWAIGMVFEQKVSKASSKKSCESADTIIVSGKAVITKKLVQYYTKYTTSSSNNVIRNQHSSIPSVEVESDVYCNLLGIVSPLNYNEINTIKGVWKQNGFSYVVTTLNDTNMVGIRLIRKKEYDDHIAELRMSVDCDSQGVTHVPRYFFNIMFENCLYVTVEECVFIKPNVILI